MSRQELLQLINILGGTPGNFLTGGIPVYKSLEQLRQEIRKCCNNNFPERIAKAGEFLASASENLPEIQNDDPQAELEDIIEHLRITALQIEPNKLYEIIINWLENEEYLDYKLDRERLNWLGITVKETEDEIEFIPQSPTSYLSEQLSKKSWIEFYQNFVRTAENCWEIKETRPGVFPNSYPGLEFLESLITWLNQVAR